MSLVSGVNVLKVIFPGGFISVNGTEKYLGISEKSSVSTAPFIRIALLFWPPSTKFSSLNRVLFASCYNPVNYNDISGVFDFLFNLTEMASFMSSIAEPSVSFSAIIGLDREPFF